MTRNNITQSQHRFQEIARDILWLNVTLFNRSELLVTIRQLEYADTYIYRYIIRIFVQYLSIYIYMSYLNKK